MFCPNCGNQLKEGMRFCSQCGNPMPLRPNPQASQAQPESQPQPAVFRSPSQPQAYQPQPQTYQPSKPQPQPEPAVPEAEKSAPEKKPALRDGRGKYILKRLIFCVIAIVAGILAAILFVNSRPIGNGGKDLPIEQIMPRLGVTLALILIPLLISLFFVPGLFAWGGIADRIGNGIRAKREFRPVKTAFMLPVLEQVVHVFTAMVFSVTAVSFLGLTTSISSFQNLGQIIAISRSAVSSRGYLVLLP